ncbi:uncharacterized protein LOC142586149 [Dermacentor variabilis]|uniref:uncharacterized protein LOC142586149 n=1 Tax=Dermacentor variabilis TaxID=34621 RepID=UPI003F5C3745
MAVGRIGEYHLGTNASWDEYVERLEMFCEANKIAKEEQKRAVLLSCCGEEAYGLIVTLVKPARPTTATYEEIKTTVRKHLHPRPSELYARFLFYKRNQAAEESVADYVTALRKLAEDCGFGDVQLPMDIMMRDRFVCGLQNEAVQQRLLAEHDLTFNVAYDMAATAEATAKQQRDIRMHGRDEAKDCQGMIQATRTKQDATAEGSSCYRCNGKHAPHLCSFRKATCFKCKRVGHIARACRSKDESRAARKTPEQKRKVEKSKGVYEMSALFSLCEVNEQEQKFMVKIQIQGQEVPMEVDSGASCSIVFRRDLPGFNGPPIHIELKDDAQPVFLKSLPVPLALKDDVGKEVDRLVQQGIWEPVAYSNWATPLVVYLAGREFTVITDHKPLLGLFNTDKRVPEVVSPRMLRWILCLSAYNYSLQYRRGQENSNADALSRLPAPGDEDEPQPPGDVLLLEAVECAPLQAADIAALIKKDKVLSMVKEWILSGWPSTQLDSKFAPYEAPEPVEERLDESRSRSSLKCRLPRQAASYSQTTTTATGQHGSSRRRKTGPSYPRPGRDAKINTR